MPVAVWTPKAELDLEDILFYIRTAGGRPLTAQRIGEEIAAVADRQARSPAAGSRHPAAPIEWQYCRHKRWLVFYQSHSQGIEVMRVVDASRDLPRVFAES
jgi:plasmid stabilization system protein ParE